MSACRSGARYPTSEFSSASSFGGSRTIAWPGFSTPRFPWTHTRGVFPAPQRRSNPFGIATSPIKNFGHDVRRLWGGVVAQGPATHRNSPQEQNTVASPRNRSRPTGLHEEVAGPPGAFNSESGTGTLDRYPGITICAAHGGGYLPSNATRSGLGPWLQGEA